MSRPGSIVMIVFFNSSIFYASCGSTWCSFRSALRNLSMHVGLGFIGFFLPTFIVDISLIRYIILMFSHNMGIPCNAALCDICSDWLDHCSYPVHFVSDLVIPDFALNTS